MRFVKQWEGIVLEKKSTDDLQQELMGSMNLKDFLSDNRANFNSDSPSALLNKMFERQNISKSALAKRAGMSEIYLYQIFSGRRNPSRNRLICLCFGLGADIDETQELLKRCGQAQLYPKNKRDAIIIFGLTHENDLYDINDKLFEEDEETLF